MFRPYTRTSVWRFTFALAAIFFLIFCLVIAVVYELVIDEKTEHLENRLSLAALGLMGVANAENVSKEDFIQIIQERSDRSTSLVLALDADGGLKGNLDSLPAQLPLFPRFGSFPIGVTDYSGEADLQTAIGTRIDTRFGSLIVALFDENQGLLESNFWTASLLALAAALVLTLITGFVFNAYVLRRITQISRLATDIKSGSLEKRLPVSKRRDEYDDIAVQINGMLDEIGELMDSVANVTDNIAHDLRTPLSRLRINIESTLENPGLSEEERVWREKLLAELDQLLATFNAMLELTRMEKGVSDTKKTPCMLAEICEDAVDLLAPLAEEKHQRLEIEADGAGSIVGDPDLLFRAVYNLVENAVKYTQEGSSIKITVSGRTLAIEDNGPGIPTEEIGRVFQRLYRLDKSRHSQGFGLGLSIVKAVVRLHGGAISLQDNRPGLKVVIEF